MQVTVEALRGPGADELPVEVVERKGLGHPDTICDALAEELSLTICRAHRERFGAILHHNVDKVLLWGGRSEPAFGGGRVVAPLEVFIAGRATAEHRGVRVPVEELAREGSRRWLAEHLPRLDVEQHVKIHSLVRPGASELVALFLRAGRGEPALANDTSCGVGWAPLSRLERVVDRVERALNSPAAKAAQPWIGEDVKVMGVRRGAAIELTVACAFVDRHVASLDDYVAKKARVAALAADAAREAGAPGAQIAVNAADEPARGNIYLTVTGTSAECGDDGEAGRGNRANGLIAPGRPMSMESCAGKNPVNHVGKLYGVVAGIAAHAVVEAVPEIREAHCWLVSRIGSPVTEPRVAHLRLLAEDAGAAEASGARAAEVLRAELARVDRLADDLIAGRVALDRWPLRA